MTTTTADTEQTAKLLATLRAAKAGAATPGVPSAKAAAASTAADVLTDMNVDADARSAIQTAAFSTIDSVADDATAIDHRLAATIAGLEAIQVDRRTARPVKPDGGLVSDDTTDVDTAPADDADADADTDTDADAGDDADASSDTANDGADDADDADSGLTVDFDVASLPSIGGGDPEQVYDEYNLAMLPIQLNGRDTGRRFIIRDGQFIKDVSASYKLLPNEQALAAADRVANDIGASAFEPSTGEWAARLAPHAITDVDKRRVRAFYKVGDQMDVSHPHADTPDVVEFGYTVENSIDTSASFSVGLFVYWPADDTMVWVNARDVQPSWSGYTMTKDYAKHTSGLDVDNDALRARIKSALELTDVLKVAFGEWPAQDVAPGHVKQLLGRFADDDVPDWVTAAGEALEKAVGNDTLSAGVDEDDIVAYAIPDGTSVWSLYTAIVARIWENDAASDLTKARKFNRLHDVFDPLAAPGASDAAQAAKRRGKQHERESTAE